MSKKKKFKISNDSKINLQAKIKVKSVFGEKILKKYGWEQGKGLGKDNNGTIEPVVLKSNIDRKGIGSDLIDDRPGEWDNWWSSMYDNLASKINIEPNFNAA